MNYFLNIFYLTLQLVKRFYTSLKAQNKNEAKYKKQIIQKTKLINLSKPLLESVMPKATQTCQIVIFVYDSFNKAVINQIFN